MRIAIYDPRWYLSVSTFFPSRPQRDPGSIGCRLRSPSRISTPANWCLMVRDARPIWRLLRKGNADEALRVTQSLISRASQLYPKAIEVPSLILSDFYLDTGMLQADAALTAETMRGNSNSYTWLTDPILIAHHRRDWAAEREALTPFLVYPLDAFSFAPEYVESGRLEDLRGLLQKLLKRQDIVGAYWVNGIIKLAEGKIALSIKDLRRAQDVNEPGGYRRRPIGHRAGARRPDR